MPNLIIQDNLKLKQPVVIPVNPGTRAIDAIKKEFETINPDTHKIYINDKVIKVGDESILNELNEGDSVSIIYEVKGLVKKLPGIFRNTLMLDPVINWGERNLDFSTDTATSSPNNSYSGQSNIARAYSQRPLVCGSPVIYPDLIGESIEFYQDNKKQSEQCFEVCTGVLDGGDILAGNTQLIRFNGAIAERFLPSGSNTTITNYRTGKSVDEIDGQTLFGLNEGSDGTSYAANQAGTTATTYEGTTFTLYVEKNSDTDDVKDLVDAGSVEFTVYYTATTTGGGGAPEITDVSGNGTITSMTVEQSDAVYKIVISNFNGEKSTDDNYYIDFTLTNIITGALGPFVNPVECDKMFFNVKFERGLKAEVPLEVVVYELDSKGGARTGINETFNVTYTDDTVDAIYETFEVNINNGVSWYEFTIQRTNNASQQTDKPDIATLEKVYCINEYGNYAFPKGTLLRVKMPSTQVPTGQGADNKINIRDGAVKMPSYDVNTQSITTDAPSRNFADAVLFVWRDFYELDPALLNLDELYTIANSLSENLKQFDYTFDDASASVGSVLDVILNVARVSKYWDGSQIRFWRDEAAPFNSAVLSRADIVDSSERSYTISRTSYVNGEFDSVQVEYIDRDTNTKAYIYKSFDNAGNIVSVTGANPREVKLTGCQSFVNATNRAELEIRRMLYERWSLSDTFIDAHRMIDRGAVVLYHEIYEGGDQFSGEIVNVNGNTATVDDEIELQSGVNYQVYYTNNLGAVVGPQNITASTQNTFTVASLAQAYVAGFDGVVMGSRYYITQTNTVERRYRVIDRAASGYNVQLQMTGYDDRIYEYDTI